MRAQEYWESVYASKGDRDLRWTQPEPAQADRAAYTALLARTVPVGGHAVIATFALDGPEKCSGLEVRRYDGQTLGAEVRWTSLSFSRQI